MTARATDAYRKAGVDIEGADSWIESMQRQIRSTHGASVLKDGGRFAGLFSLAGRRGKTVLVASTDGVGTKLKLGQARGKHACLGVDAVAMNTNDVLVHGAQPLFFLDYIAVGKLQPRVMSALMRGVVEGCKQSNCALLGGETAEMPGVYEPDEYEIVGFAVGAVDAARRITGKQVKRGDAIIGLASTGVHANGFSLVRKAFSAAELKRHSSALLRPTRIYVKPVMDLISVVPVKAISHVTGGGLQRRIPALTQAAPGLQASLAPGSWRVPPIFKRIQASGGLDDGAMAATFNMGVGMALVCPRAAVPAALRRLARHKVPAWEIGSIEKG